MYLYNIPKVIHWIYPHFLWREKTREKVMYLTFDDGPTPQVTDWVMDQLDQWQAKATFFVIGKNVALYPEITARVLAQGHTLGNHTQTHANGRKTSHEAYISDFRQAEETIRETTGTFTYLFRPPYGKIRPAQTRVIRKTHKIVMMDVLAGDFDPTLDKEKCLQHVLGFAREGSVICLHDSEKAFPRLEYVLPRVLEHFHAKGFRFEPVRQPSPTGNED